MRNVTGVIVTVLLAVGSSVAADWPQFRGPGGDGVASAQGLPTTWGGFLEPPAWSTSLPGSGWSSPIVVGRRVWVTAAEQTALTADALEQRLEEHEYGAEEFQTHAAVQLMALEIDADRGELLRRVDLLEHQRPTPIHHANTYASPTPVSDGQRLYCHFGSLGTMALDMASGRVLWQKQFVVDDITGPGGSPVLWHDLLILSRDGADEQYVVALDKHSGSEVWRAVRPEIDAAAPKHRRAFSTPLVVDDPHVPQVIAPAANWVVSYDPATGTERWRARMPDGHAVVPRPVVAHGMVFVCSGYHQPQLLAIRIDGRGDVTASHVVWTHDRQVPLIASPLIDGDELYCISTTGIATCLDARSGQVLWRERLPGNYASSPLLADGKLYFTSMEGVTTVLRPGRAFHQLARNRLPGQIMASLAVDGQSLLVRTAGELICVRKSPYDGGF